MGRDMSVNSDFALEMKQITKDFGGVKALRESGHLVIG
jgi:hypothetical protein